MSGWARSLGMALSIAGVVTVAGASLNRVYNGQLLVVLVAGAAVGSVLLPVLLRRAAAFVVAPLSLVALGGYAAYALEVSARAGGITGDLSTVASDAARNALPRLLTALIPIEPQPDTVLAPVVLAWLAGLAGAELAVRANRYALACVPPVLLYAGVLVLVGPNAAVVIWQPVAVAALVAVGLAAGRTGPVARRRPRSGAGTAAMTSRERAVLRARATAGLAAAIVALLAVIAAVSPLVAQRVGASPADPRVLVRPPDLDVLDENPLIRISGWAADPGRRLFTVAVLHGSPGPAASPAPSDSSPDSGGGAYDTRLRLAVLEDWDGVTWHAGADYRGAGRVLPPLDLPAGWSGHPDAPPLEIQEKITVAGLEGRLLPAVPTPSRVDGLRVSFDRTSGTLIRDSPLRPGTSYTVNSVDDAVDVNLLPAADVPSGPAVAHLLAVGDEVPADLSHLAEEISNGQSSPYDRAFALQDFLARHYRFAADAPSGHAYPNLRFFLYGDPRAGGQRGTSEQFSAAFAALGRLMGLPTRVVVGFHTPSGGGTVTAGDALAWPEVLFSDVGWVAFDPLPQADAVPVPLEEQYLPQQTPPTQPPETVPPPSTTFAAAPASSAVHAGGAPPGLSAAEVGGALGGGLLALGVLIVLVLLLLRGALRRRRLDRGSAPEKVIGAWDEVLDTLLLAGQPPPAHLAATGVAAHAAAVASARPGRRHTRRPRPAAPPLDDLAARVNAVGFGPAPSASDDLAAHSARVAAIGYARAVRAGRPWWHRLLWSVDPRPLRRKR